RVDRCEERPAGRSVVRGRGRGRRGAGGGAAGGRGGGGRGRGGRRLAGGRCGGGRGRGRHRILERRHTQLTTVDQRHLVEAELVHDRVRGLGELAILCLVAGEMIRMTRRRRVLVVLACGRAEEDGLGERQGGQVLELIRHAHGALRELGSSLRPLHLVALEVIERWLLLHAVLAGRHHQDAGRTTSSSCVPN